MKTILMILSSTEFRDIEYITPRAFFEQAGFSVKTASTCEMSIGRFGYKNHNDFLIDQVTHEDFDGIYFVGGKGALEYQHNQIAKKLFLAFNDVKKPIAAICAAPRNLLYWGMMKGKKVTGNNWDGDFDNLCKEVEASSCVRQGIILDQNILTANGPEVSEQSALRFIDMF